MDKANKIPKLTDAQVQRLAFEAGVTIFSGSATARVLCRMGLIKGAPVNSKGQCHVLTPAGEKALEANLDRVDGFTGWVG